MQTDRDIGKQLKWTVTIGKPRCIVKLAGMLLECVCVMSLFFHMPVSLFGPGSIHPPCKGVRSPFARECVCVCVVEEGARMCAYVCKHASHAF